MWRATIAALAASVALFAARADAQVELLDGFGGAAGYGTDCLGPNDDSSSRMIDLSPVFPFGVQFFDLTHTSMYVNTNGNITFSRSVSAYTPSAFPVADQPMIAPYWADVDIRGAACAFDAVDAHTCHDPTDNGVWWYLDTETPRVIVTWDNVGYYSCSDDKRMSFQLILTPVATGACGTAGDFDVEFRFNRCEWNTGDASGGEDGLAIPGAIDAVPAQAGFDAGNGADFVEVPGSRSLTIHTTMCTMSNVGEPGIWRYQIRSGAIVCPGAGETCATGLAGVCAEGRTQCIGDSVECRSKVAPSDERCDGLDNDCDGQVDDGDLCGADHLCDRGVCLAHCFEGGCGEGFECSPAGRCISAGCEDVACAEDETCRLGACVASCEGIVCPTGRSCRGGRCVDPCDVTLCDECSVCDEGACVPRCSLVACRDGQTCRSDGRCVDVACAAMTCPLGSICREGGCRDACDGAICPEGEVCLLGECGPPPPPPAPPPPDASVPDAATDGNVYMDPFTFGPPPESRGCGCAVPAGSRPTRALFGLLALFAFVGWRRRR